MGKGLKWTTLLYRVRQDEPDSSSAVQSSCLKIQLQGFETDDRDKSRDQREERRTSVQTPAGVSALFRAAGGDQFLTIRT